MPTLTMTQVVLFAFGEICKAFGLLFGPVALYELFTGWRAYIANWGLCVFPLAAFMYAGIRTAGKLLKHVADSQ